MRQKLSGAFFLGRASGSREQAHESAWRKVWGEEAGLGLAGGAGQRFGREISAADCALHGGGPAGRGPVAGEEYAWPRGGGGGAVSVDSWARGVGGDDFLDHGGFREIGGAGGGEELADFGEGEVNDFGFRFVDERFRGADDELDVAAGFIGNRG